MMMVYWNGVASTSAFNHGLDDRLSVCMHTAKALYRLCTPTYEELMIDDSLIHSSQCLTIHYHHRRDDTIRLNFENVRDLDQGIVDGYVDWVNGAPDNWTADG